MAGPQSSEESEPEHLEPTQIIATAGRVAPGTTLGHYRIVGKLGQGGMGAVYLAVDDRLDRPVAIKVIGRDAAGENESRRFLREAKAASALNHPNIITVHDFGFDAGRDYIVMEFVEGKTLDELARAGTPLPQMLEYKRQLAGALAKAHASGIVHRDLKPTNVMVTADGVVKVLDFGLAKMEASAPGEQTATALTAYGAAIGTPWYMSPEQALGEPVDYRSDVFSFGIILYQIACGRRPFQGATAQATMVEIANCVLPSAAKACPGLQPELAELIDRCLRKSKEDRLQSMDEAASILSRALAAPVRKKRGPAWIAGIAVALLAIGAGLLLLSRRPAETPRPAEAPRPVAPLARVALSCRLLQRTPSGEEPASLAETFHAGTAFKVKCSSDTPGYVYIVNEGPGASAARRYWMVYPKRAGAPAQAAVETDWLVFDEYPGSERLWIIQSRDPIPILEECRRESRGGLIAPARNADVAAVVGGSAAETRTEPGGAVRFQTSDAVLRGVLNLNHQ